MLILVVESAEIPEFRNISGISAKNTILVYVQIMQLRIKICPLPVIFTCISMRNDL